MKNFSVSTRVFVAGLIITLSSTTAIAQESPKTKGFTCFEAGVWWSKCAMIVATGIAASCPNEYDFVKPARCEKNSDFDNGIQQGVREFKKSIDKQRK